MPITILNGSSGLSHDSFDEHLDKLVPKFWGNRVQLLNLAQMGYPLMHRLLELLVEYTSAMRLIGLWGEGFPLSNQLRFYHLCIYTNCRLYQYHPNVDNL